MQLGAEARSPNILLQINLLFTFIKANSSTLLIIATARDSFIVRAGRNLESSGPTPIRGLSSYQALHLHHVFGEHFIFNSID